MADLDIQSVLKSGLNENLDGNHLRNRYKDSRYLKIVRFWLTVSGLWKNSSDRSRNIPVNCVILSTMLVGFFGTAYELFFVSENINAGMEILMTVCLIGHSISTYTVLMWRQPTILKMLAIVESRFDEFSQIQLEHSKLQYRAEKTSAVWSVMISVIIFSVHTSSVVYSKGLLVYLPLANRTLLLPITVPFQLSESTYYLIFTLELLCMVCEAITHISSITLCTGFINILCSEFSVLGKSFSRMSEIVRRDASLCQGTKEVPKHHPEAHLDHHAALLLNIFVDHHLLLLQ